MQGVTDGNHLRHDKSGVLSLKLLLPHWHCMEELNISFFCLLTKNRF